jgi:AcrR family transcriptional regulator
VSRGRPQEALGGPAGDERAAPAGPIWARPAKEERTRPTRGTIVAAAIRLADDEGLDAVSIRRVAAALETRPMGLYSHFDRKDDLIDLMIDEVLAEALLDEVPTHWREALSALAHALRGACLAHPWLVTAAGRRPQIGPNVIRQLEQALAATAGLDIERTKRLAVVRAVNTYAMGHAQLGVAEARESPDQHWRTAADAYLQQLVRSGDFPHLAAFGTQGVIHEAPEDCSFETGLDWLLAGIAAEIGDAPA